MISIHFVQYYPKIIIYYHILNNKIYACIVFIHFQIYIYIYVLLISFYAILCHFYFSFIPYLIIFEFRRNFSLKKKKKKIAQNVNEMFSREAYF